MTRAQAQRGSVLLFVTMIGLAISLLLAFFLNSTVLTEQRAVERELAKARVYWAEMGDFNYALSRISYSSLCNTASCGTNQQKDSDLATIYQQYFNELSNNATWTYADESSNYSFTTTITAAADNRPLRQNFSGWLMASSSYFSSTLMTASSGKLPLMEMRLCVGLATASSTCGLITANNGGLSTPYFSINRVTNLPYF